jgi:hypothetical protein
LWDSRTIHWNQYPKIISGKVKMVGYLCYVPKTRIPNEYLKKRLFAFENCIQYMEDPDYTPPIIKLTHLGKSLLGL